MIIDDPSLDIKVRITPIGDTYILFILVLEKASREKCIAHKMFKYQHKVIYLIVAFNVNFM